MRNNKWQHGDADFKLPDFPENYFETSLLYDLPIILDPEVGSEICLAVKSTGKHIFEIKSNEPIDFYLKVGAVKTSYGPLVTLLFYIPDKDNPDNPIYMSDRVLNPFDMKSFENWFKLANQSYWHLMLINEKMEIDGFYEFENGYNLQASLETILIAVIDSGPTDYELALQEYFKEYTLQDILHAK